MQYPALKPKGYDRQFVTAIRRNNGGGTITTAIGWKPGIRMAMTAR